MPKRRLLEDDSSSESSDSSSSASDSSEESGDDAVRQSKVNKAFEAALEALRSVSGDKVSDKEDDASEPDAKDQFLAEAFKEKPVVCSVSDWCKQRLRGAFLGTVLSSDERKEITQKYFCSDKDFKLFSAPQIHGKPCHLLLRG